MNPKPAPEPRVPSDAALMWPVLRAMKELNGSARNQELLQKVIEIENIPEVVQDVPDTPGRTKLAKNVDFAKSKLKKWGALENPSTGVWTITEKGRALTEEEVRRIPGEVQKLYHSADETGPDADDAETELRAETETWKDELLKALMKMSPDAFQRLSALILRKRGFDKVVVTGKPGDEGIDGEGLLRMDLLSFRVCFQCKRYQKPVGSPEVQQFRGAIGRRADRALFITTSTFTSPARKEAEKNPLIDLVDGDRLCELLKDLELGVAKKVVVDRSWFEKI
jgi:restriction system protein